MVTLMVTLLINGYYQFLVFADVRSRIGRTQVTLSCTLPLPLLQKTVSKKTLMTVNRLQPWTDEGDSGLRRTLPWYGC